MNLTIGTGCDHIELILTDSLGDVQFEKYIDQEEMFDGMLARAIMEVVKRVSGNTVKFKEVENY